MYKTIRHGENSLQYTILPQNDDFRMDGKITGSGSGGNHKSKRGKRRSFFAYLGLLFVCTVIIGAVLVPFLVSAEFLPNPSDWIMRTRTALLMSNNNNNISNNNNGNNKSINSNNNNNNNSDNSSIITTIINNIENINSSISDNTKYNSSSSSSSFNDNTRGITSNTNNKNNNNNSINKNNLNSIQDYYQNENGNISSLNETKSTINNNNNNNNNAYPSEKVNNNNNNNLSQFIYKKMTTASNYNINNNNNNNNKIAASVIPIETTTITNIAMMKPVEHDNENGNNLISSSDNVRKYASSSSSSSSSSLSLFNKARTSNNAIGMDAIITINPEIEQNHKSINGISTIKTMDKSNNYEKDSKLLPMSNPNDELTEERATILTTSKLSDGRFLVSPTTASTKKPIILPVLAKTNSIVRENGKSVDSREEPKNWIRSHWPFIDPSTYFQWAGYKSEDSVLLPAILGVALIGIILIITLCLVARNKRTIVASVRKRNRNDIEEAGDDNTTLLTTGNLSDDD